MAFKKGVSGNPNGRPIGAKNKSNEIVSAIVNDFFCENIERLKEESEQLSISDRVRLVTALANYILPKQQPIVTESVNHGVIQIIATPEQYELLQKLKE